MKENDMPECLKWETKKKAECSHIDGAYCERNIANEKDVKVPGVRGEVSFVIKVVLSQEDWWDCEDWL